MQVDFLGRQGVVVLALSRELQIKCARNPPGHRDRRFAVCLPEQVFVRNGGDLNLHVDAVQQGTGNFALISVGIQIYRHYRIVQNQLLNILTLDTVLFKFSKVLVKIHHSFQNYCHYYLRRPMTVNRQLLFYCRSMTMQAFWIIVGKPPLRL